MSKSYIKTAHEETYSDGKSLGILVNYSHNDQKINSYAYIYKENIYIFFDTIIDMNEYLLYGDNKIKRAYIKEDVFDDYYDNGLNEKFEDVLKWME